MLTYLVEENRPGDEVTLAVICPDGEQERVKVTLAVRPGVDSINESNK